MLKATIILILSLILIILCVILLFKNFLSNFKKGGFIGLIIIVLFIIALLCGLASFLSASSMQQIMDALKHTENLPENDILFLKQSLAFNTRTAVTSIILGYIIYGINTVLLRKVKRDIEAEIEKNSHKTWKHRKEI